MVDTTPEAVLQRAAALGLPLTSEEAVPLAKGIARNEALAARVRRLLVPTTEPASTFSAAPAEGK